jgi:hypothetical protein
MRKCCLRFTVAHSELLAACKPTCTSHSAVCMGSAEQPPMQCIAALQMSYRFVLYFLRYPYNGATAVQISERE